MAKMTTKPVSDIASRGSAFPMMISVELAALARSRSQVFQPYSERNAKLVMLTMKNALRTACPGTTCSEPFALR